MEQDAEDMIRPEHIRRFRRLARGMAKLLVEIREYCPDANLYLEDQGNWNLMVGDSHDWGNYKNHARQDRVAAHEVVRYSGGGAW